MGSEQMESLLKLMKTINVARDMEAILAKVMLLAVVFYQLRNKFSLHLTVNILE
jgi:hypothetical protein